MSDTEDLTEKYVDLARRIAKGQSKLKRRNRNSSLLNIVKVDSNRIHWTEELGVRYGGVRTDDGRLDQYVNDLEGAAEKATSR